jgi:hypothetical protein
MAYGRVAEWFKAAVLKTARGFTLPRGFESHPFRQNILILLVNLVGIPPYPSFHPLAKRQPSVHARPPMNLHDQLADLALSIQVAATREEAWDAVERFLETEAAQQLSRIGHWQLAAIVGKRIASLPDE